MGILENIGDFGAIDAENDDRLFDYFIQSESLRKLIEKNRRIIIGRKGSGKTAIYKFLSKSEENKLTSALLFRDYPWKVHDQFANSNVSERESYVNSWEFLVYVELAKLIVKDICQYGFFEKIKIRKLRKWLTKSWGSSDFNHKETMNPLNWSFTFAPSIFGNSLGSISKTDLPKNLGSTLGEVNKKLKMVLLPLIKKRNNYLLLFDELDLSYDPNDSKYLTRIIGLLVASYNINSYFQEREENVGVYIFLRSDIYEVLNFQDKNKLTDNHVEYLNWNQDENANLSLKKLAAKRIKENIEQTSDLFQENWGMIFDAANIGSNQLKWNFIIERTFLRPRDLIKFLNLSLYEAQKRIKTNAEGDFPKIINKDIHGVRKDYSDYLYSELKDEVSVKYSDFDSYLEILRDMHKTIFNIENYETSFEACATRLKITDNSSNILERLYEFSVVGFYKPGGGGYGGATYCYRYTDPKIKFNPKATNYKVHPGFKEYLELIDG